MDTNATIAFSRFGLGRRRDEAVPQDARAWLRAQIDAPDAAPTDGLLNSAQALGLVAAVIEAKKEAKEDGGTLHGLPSQHALAENEQAERAALLDWAITTPAGFRERLVWFWANHFTVAARSRPASATCGAYIREAIRPNVTGKFRDMLLAVMHHPAMLAYLDQNTSIGPDSPVGQRRHGGINENLARECLELHTITPAAGYTQADVTNFARLLTGFSFEMIQEPRGFKYRFAAHEPGEQTIMGQSWPDSEQGVDAFLVWLANHPSTQRHLAEKLVRHFVSDDPPPADVARIEAVLRESGGDLGEAAHALIDLPDAWKPLTKLRAPQDYVVAVMRCVGARPDKEPQLWRQVQHLGQPLFGAPFPIGWPDRAQDWAGPEALLQRVDFAYQFAGRVTDQEPSLVAENTLGPLLSDETMTEIRRAGSRQDGLSLLLASPEFQRR